MLAAQSGKSIVGERPEKVPENIGVFVVEEGNIH